ncbi:choice-of-anchor D domain-containing protein [Flavobacterium sp.]|uniref:choice-of-anchor D domain-containing protein n=1 Tax=Flavobacterium sp. TaxID=239 RepID=UPI00122BD4E3|nr:choice-of-anchor D domain-containing protein [Flavobacterium sp.]RZJ73629.1 MAG: choice-of-anchor D domain-containing protein [Flavobacterium sp.]
MDKITRLQKQLFSTLILLFVGFVGQAQQEIIDTPGTGQFTVPTGVTSIQVQVWGAGGHGGDRTGSSGKSGGGGGGAYAFRTITVTPGQTINYSVGAGSNDNNPGQDTWFLAANNIMAKGGNSAANNSNSGATGGSAAASFGAAKYSGGSGSGSSNSFFGGYFSGGGGSSAGSGADGNSANSATGATAPANGGNGGAGISGSATNGDGANGAQPGGGGGGASRQNNNREGGQGGHGLIKIWYQDINVRGNNVAIANNDMTPSTADFTDFGSINVVSGTQSRNFQVDNTGGIVLSSVSVSIGGANASDFTITASPTATINATSTQTLTIVFNPSDYGTRSAIVTITSNDPDENPYIFAIRGTGTGSDMSVTGNSIFIADGNTAISTSDNTDFGTMSVATGTIVKQFVVSNSTNASSLTVSGVTFSGTNPGDFSVTPTTATIAGGASQIFSVTFNPSAVGARNAMINFATNDADNNPYNFNLRGTGGDADISVRGNGNTIATGTTGTSTATGTNMGTVAAAGTANSTQTFLIHNLTGASYPLTVSSVTSSNAQFTISGFTANTTIPVGNSTPFTVTFDPTSAGNQTAIITINSDDITSVYTFALSGTGTAPEIDVLGNGNSIVDGDTTPSTTDNTNFGATLLNGGMLTKTFTIANTSVGSMPLNIGTITVIGAAAGDFTVTQPTVTTLAVNATVNFTIAFDPSATGARNATVVIPNDDPNENPYDFAIVGTGNDPEMGVTGNSVAIADGTTTTSVSDNTDFGSVNIDGGAAITTFVITNTGVGPLNIGAISFSGAAAANYSIAAAPPASIAQGASASFQVSFNPTTIGIKNATMFIVNDDFDENPYNFNLTGLGVRTYPDTDGDGITDNIDIDDDNDGIIDTLDQSNCQLSPLSSVYEHVFLNETFGAGTTKGLININIPGATSTYCYEDGIVQANTTACPYQSSTVLDDGEYVVVHRIANTTYGHPDNIHYDLAWNGFEDHTPGDTFGRMAVFNASFAPGTFYETTIQGVMPNVPIAYSFWALNILSSSVYNGTIKPNITVEFLTTTGTLITSYNTGDIGRCGTSGTGDNSCTDSQWRQYSTSVNLGNVTSFIIRFKNNAPGGNGNDLALDDIVIKQTYCDRDSDGVANVFDLDSDNDGIPDIEEAGFASLSGGLGRMDLTAGVWVDANGNGLHDTIDAMIANGTYNLPDTDGDGVRNFQDLDSDNDSLFDVDESGLSNGDGDVNGDGLGDGIDTDKDGILDKFDTFVGWGTQVRPFAANTDGAGNPDYMQLDSNSDGVFDIAGSLYANLDTNNDGRIDGNTDVDKDGILDNFDTTVTALGSPRNLERKLYIDFDGRNDYAEGSQILSSLPQSTIMGWIKIPSGYASDAIVFGQENFMIRIPANMQLRTVAKGVTVSGGSTNVLQPNRWYHVAATFDGTQSSQQLRLYLNGTQVAVSAASSNATLSGALAASTNKFTIAKNAASSANFFNGSVEEVRAFNVTLTPDQLQKMVYQEIRENAGAIRGEFVPKNVEGTSWPSVLAYYRMDNFKDDVIDNHITTAIDAGSSTSLARIYNVKNIRYQLAPMPFVTTQSSSIETAVSQNNFVNGADIYTYNYSIVDVRHNINLTQNTTGLGMRILPGVRVNLNNNNKLENNWWLKLDGILDLQGKSQLVQGEFSDLDATSAGYLEKDQQGTTNRFNYNYWSSPVGAINAATNNNNYTVSGVMKDGTNAANPLNMNWTTGVNSSATSPITLSSYWIYKFQNTSNNYANWVAVGQNGQLTPGQGYTLKGSNAPSESQNFTFRGKPYNGLITLPIAPNMLNLAGNPYASAMDANAFITDNAGVINGAIHFWEHFGTNTTHVTAFYQGGYATYTLVGGTPPVAHPDASGLGSSTRTPKRYIPVGQGFFVTATATGGTIRFKNTQRAFIKEDNALSYAMFRPSGNAPVGDNSNAEDAIPSEVAYPKIRIGYDYANGYHRQVLIGFMDDLATPDFDFGYDADNYDSNPDEMVFRIGDHRAIIQGDGYFDATSSYPLEVKAAAAGNVKFSLDGTENFDADQPIYIFDNQTGLYHDLRDESFALNLPAGTHEGRFYLRFLQQAQLLKADEKTASANLKIAYDEKTSVLSIRNMFDDMTVKKATLMNMLGQSVNSYDVESQDQDNIQIKLKNVSAGTYLVKIETTGGLMTQKVVIK